MLRVVWAACLASVASQAWAADEVVLAPPAAWVKAAPQVPLETTPGDGHALKYLRLDRQLDFGPDGDAIYQESVAQIRTALGLSAAGTISVSWDPSRERLTVHKVLIRRADANIDVLARQKFAIIRREESLKEIVDGRLTATLQPEDLRIGDILEVAYTLVRTDPVLGGRTDFALDLGATRSVSQFTLRARLPAKEKIAWRKGDGLPSPTLSKRGDITELQFDLRDPQPLKGPVGAHRRYWPTRMLEFSEFATWEEVSALLAPAYESASILGAGSPLKAEAAKIREQSSDPKQRASAALKLVQDQVRYLGLVLTDGGYTPVGADRTWERRFGECKAKTTLLIALLRELGIEAEPVLVNAYGGETLDQNLPRLSAFNHVIARVTIDGRVYWLDGTSAGDGDTALDTLRAPDFHWGLPLRRQGATLTPITRTPSLEPDMEIALDVDASGGIESLSPVTGTMVARGPGGRWPAMLRDNLPAADREKMLKMMWASYPWIEVKTTEMHRDPRSGATLMKMTGTARLRWFPAPGGVGWLSVPNAGSGYRADFKREPGPGEDAPFEVHPVYSTQRFSVRLPYGGKDFSAPAADLDRTVAGRTFRRRTTTKDDRITVETSVRSVASEFPASEAEAAAESLTAMSQVRVVIQGPRDYRPTPGDIEGWIAAEPKTAAEFQHRGGKFARVGRNKEALADFDKALALEPTSSVALSGRGILRLDTGELELARRDLDEALQLDPQNASAHGGIGLIALREGRAEDAVEAFSKSARLTPGNTRALFGRATAYRDLAQHDKALADLAEILAISPKAYMAHLDRASVYVALADHDRALAEVDAAAKVAPTDPYVDIFRGALLAKAERRVESDRAFERALAIKPTAQAYLTRAANRPKAELAGRLADISAAAKLTPDDPDIASLRARAYIEAEQPAKALSELARVLKAEPGNRAALEQRATAYIRLNDAAAARRDFQTLRTKANGDGRALNALCWTQTTLGFDLEAALADCDAALKLLPDSPNVLDSRGLALLRLGRLSESVAAYDRAAALRPTQAETLFGRGLAKRRLGQEADGNADLDAGRKARRGVEAEFKSYGLTAS
ncbi:MAG: hypothetical protein DI570_03715 [Phenylobacterium zucineum]|nr:MAG: hypothetical protein DI570_03715 [Phenylobacterium zucineum]